MPDPQAVLALAAALAEVKGDIRTLQAGQHKGPDPTGYVSLREAAYAVGRSTEAIRLYAIAGKVIAQNRRGRWFVELESLRNFLEQR